jgi:Domain of unknown function (DUF5655)/Domain of unknown function (DUF4287)
MNTVEKAKQTQLKNIQKKTGKDLKQLATLIKRSGLTKHSEIRDMLKRKLKVGHGDASALVQAVLKSDGERAAEGKSYQEMLEEMYSGSREILRPIHDAVMHEVAKFGEFEIAPRKGYVSLRRRKQFAMLGPTGRTRLELGLNVKDLPPADRLMEQPRGSMCNYKVVLNDITQVNAELAAWLHFAFESAG